MLPYFYHEALVAGQQVFTLDEATSKHCIQVLRMQEGEHMLLTNGKGLRARVSIVAAERKRCGVQVVTLETLTERPYALSLGIAFTKNNSRNEWLLEKATEMGIEHIYPLTVQRSEKEKFNAERLKLILISAMLQSQQCFLPRLHEPQPLKQLMTAAAEQKLLAHCLSGEPRHSLLQAMQPSRSTLVLIGPEGDFTREEVSLCLEQGFSPVSLGANRLRTETAGLYACTVFNALNYA
ncbi:RsmE family RNA methyltransferase [Taibaiella koreensis]|uniref:RsmE family RNA methyltransferase n=1 Tax=Taibaiella koreensis TaxID=1268548 RepID=UPI000E59F8F9|nr:RsmE family RNA methyltransferase [Taibaiella koreensis]